MLTLLSALDHHARVTPDKPAMVVCRRGTFQQFSFADLHAETERWARIWLASGARQGAVVFIILQHCQEMFPAFLGAMRAGLIPSYMPFPTPKQDPKLYWQSHKELFARVAPACVLTYAELVDAIRGISDAGTCQVFDAAAAPRGFDGPLPALAELDDPGSTALLQHSSGTTGLKKGVALTWRQIRDQLGAYAQAIAATGEDRIVSWLPIYHDMGLITGLLLPVTIGAMVVCLDAFEWLTRPDMFFDAIAQFRGTLGWLPNFAFNHLVRTRDRDRHYDLSSLRLLINCSEPCKAETMDAFLAVFTRHGLQPLALQVCYGMAEVVFGLTQTPADRAPRVIAIDRAALSERSEAVLVEPESTGSQLFVSCGLPIKGAQLRIAAAPAVTGLARLARDLADRSLGNRRAPGMPVGEIEVRCPFLFDGYFRNPAATAAAVTGGWLKTGDIGFLLDGELYVCGRAKEMLIVHGRNFYANDIEGLINTLAGIKPGRCVAVGVFDPVTGSEEAVVLAETVLTEDADRCELEQAIRKRVFDVLNLTLRRVDLAAEGALVKTTSGKISRDENVRRLKRELVPS
jgi:acyl-CoA synthetase (AMP-forming)/AMP-acid ligase II